MWEISWERRIRKSNYKATKRYKERRERGGSLFMLDKKEGVEGVKERATEVKGVIEGQRERKRKRQCEQGRQRETRSLVERWTQAGEPSTIVCEPFFYSFLWTKKVWYHCSRTDEEGENHAIHTTKNPPPSWLYHRHPPP